MPDEYTVRLTRDQILRLLDGYPVQVPTAVGLLDVVGVKEVAWQPLRCEPMTPAILHHHARMGIKPPDELWSNETYEVFASHADEGSTHLSIKRYDRAPIRNWRHFQQMKNEIVGPEHEALELFPRESRLADNANQYHLWVLPIGMDIPVGFPDGMVLIRDDEVAQYNDARNPGRQEPRQDGLTIGDTLDGVRTPAQDEQVQVILDMQPGGGR